MSVYLEFIPFDISSLLAGVALGFLLAGIIVIIIYSLTNRGKMNIKPTGNRVIVKPDATEEKKYGSIIIPDVGKEKPQTGIITATGDGEDLAKLNLRGGDHVLYAKYGGTECTIDGEDVIILNCADVLVVFLD